MKKIIIENKARCKKCGDIIESKHVHDYVKCKCGAIAVDGGHYYLRRSYPGGNYKDYIEDLSVEKLVEENDKDDKNNANDNIYYGE